jgi:4-amino-4-deoxy-L-arabinose transferase-like glycosyltransferase
MIHLQSLPDRQAMVYIPLWFVYLVTFISVFAGLGSYSIFDNNEGLYAQIAREMLHSGDWRHWVIPHLNTLVYMEKPPLLYWLTALSFAIFGESAWSARLVPALSALTTVALMLRFGRYVAREQASRLAAIIFISGLGVTIMSRNLMFDMLLTALFSAALMSAYAFVVEVNNRRALRYSFAFLALVVLTKGLVGIALYFWVVCVFVACLSSSYNDFLARCRLWLDWRAVGIFLLIAAPWHVLASFVEPFFAWFYFVNEHVFRFLGIRVPHDYYSGSWWYYLPRMVIYLFPWSLLLLGLAWEWVRRKSQIRHTSSQPLPLDHWQLMKFLTVAWLVPLLFFSLSSAKANYYLLIVMPFAALQLAIVLSCVQFGGVFVRVLPGVISGGFFTVLALNLDWLPPYLAQFSIGGLSGDNFLIVSFYLLAGVSFVAALLAWKRPRVGVLWYLISPLVTVVVLLNVLGSASQLSSSSLVAQRISSNYPDRQVLLYRMFDERSSLVFYLKTPLKVVESGGADLFWGQRLYGGDMILTHREFNDLMQTKKIVLVVLDRDLENLAFKTYAPKLVRKERFLGVSLYFN